MSHEKVELPKQSQAGEHSNGDVDLSKQTLEELYENEANGLEKFFGRKMEVPPLPAWVTPERVVEWKEKGLEVHYLPSVDMKDEQNAPGWKKKPNYRVNRIPPLAPDVMRIPGGWIVIDGRPKPQENEDSSQMYADDFLAPILEELNQKGFIEQCTRGGGKPLDPTTRFGITPLTLDQPEVKSAFAKVLGIDPDSISLPPSIVFNVIGNMHHPEWGETDCFEWFGDSHDRQRFLGGSSIIDGLSGIVSEDPFNSAQYYGFRLMGWIR